MTKGELEQDYVAYPPEELIKGAYYLTISLCIVILICVVVGFFTVEHAEWHMTWVISAIGLILFIRAGYITNDNAMWTFSIFWLAMLIMCLLGTFGPSIFNG
jgi:uncharacterized membrane protein YeiH